MDAGQGTCCPGRPSPFSHVPSLVVTVIEPPFGGYVGPVHANALARKLAQQVYLLRHQGVVNTALESHASLFSVVEE
jgi:hypothetical protein